MPDGIGDGAPLPQSLDELVAQSRASGTPVAANRRRIPRSSIAELNELDAEELHDRMLRVAYDSRGPVTKVLDLVDAPRNYIAGLIAPKLKERAEREGNIGTGGRGKVFVSDMLGEMGLRDGAVKTILGFVGDVAIDPTTYAGGAGIIKNIGKGGAVGLARRSGIKGLQSAVKAAATEGLDAVRNPVFREVIEAGGHGFTKDAIEWLRSAETLAGTASAAGTAERSAYIRKLLMEHVQGAEEGGRIGKTISTLTRGDREFKGGVLGHLMDEVGADAVGAETRKAYQKAAAGFYSKYGKGTEPALVFGDGASTIAHIPFTEYSLRVPGFTSTARQGALQGKVARSVLSGASVMPKIKEVVDAERAIGEYAKTAENISRAIPDIDPSEGLHVGGPIVGLKDDAAEFFRQYDEYHEIGKKSPPTQPEWKSALDAENARKQGQPIHSASQVVSPLDVPEIDPAMVGAGGLSPPPVKSVFTEDVENFYSKLPKANPLDELRLKQAEMDTALTAAEKAHTDGRLPLRDLLLLSNRVAESNLRAQMSRIDEIRNARGLNLLTEMREGNIARQDLSSVMRELVSNTELNPARAELLSESHSKMAEANLRLSDIYKQPLVNALRSSDRLVVQAAKLAMGVADEQVGLSAIAGMRAAAEMVGAKPETVAEFLGGPDRLNRGLFAQRGGSLLGGLRTQKSLERGAQVVKNAVAVEYYNRVRDAALAAGMTPNASNLQMLSELANAKLIELVDKGKRYARMVRDLKSKKMVPSELVVILEKLRGMAATNPAMVESIGRIAADVAEKYRNIADIEYASGLLSSPIDFYAASGPTKQARADMAAVARQPGRLSAPTGTKSAVHSFQKERSTSLYTVLDEAGEPYQFTEFDREFMSKFANKEQLAAYAKNLDGTDDPERLASLQSLWSAVKQYENTSPSMRSPMQYVDPWTMNKWAKEYGAFAFLHGQGGGYKGKFMETELPLLLANRTASHELAMGRANAAKMLNFSSIPYDDTELRKLAGTKGGAQYNFRGTLVRISRVKAKDGSDADTISVGGMVYRTLSENSTELLKGPLNSIFGADISKRLFPEVMADRIDDVLHAGEDHGTLFRAVNQITSYWKVITLARPAWVINNLIGNTWLAISAGADPKTYTKHFKDVLQVRWSRGVNGAIEAGGVKYGAEEAQDIMVKYGVFSEHQAQEQVARAIEAGVLAAPSAVNQAVARGRGESLSALARSATPGALKSDILHFASDYANARSPGSALRTSDIARGVGKLGGDRIQRYWITPFMQMNAASDDVLRGAAFWTFVDQGHDFASAAKRVRESMGDFVDFSRDEEVLRLMIPFYSWMRNNVAYQARLLVERPSVAASIPKLQQAIEEFTSSESQLPDAKRPTWMRDAIAIQYAADPEKRGVMLAGGVIPTADILPWLAPVTGTTGIGAAMKNIGSQINPLFSVPLQAAMGRELTTGKTIGKAGESDVGYGEFVAKQISPLRELGIGSPGSGPLGQAFDASATRGIGRFLWGGRLQDASDDRIMASLRREYEEKTTTIRRVVNRAERAGNQTESLEARALLMNVYGQMVKAGLADDVPKWAMRQLAHPAQNPLQSTP